MSTLVKVARAEDVPEGTVRYAEANGVRLAICNVAGKFYAIQDVCTHDGGSLDQGELDGIAIECPRHGGRFDVTTGRVLALPPVRPIRTYPVGIEDGEIAVEVD